MFVRVLCFFTICVFLVPITWSEKRQKDDAVICRSCGNFVISSSDLIREKSPSALTTFNDTLFGREHVLVQVLKKDIIFTFPIITANNSRCIGFGEWEEEEELWFPGYRWKPCLCPDCGTLVGWIFDKIDSEEVASHDKFYTLILPNLVSEQFLEYITVYPLL